MSSIKLKCRKCRLVLIPEDQNCVVSVHNEPINTDNVKVCQEQCTGQNNDVFYIQDARMPVWINNTVNEKGWVKGKLMCPKCSARLGSFDFVSGAKCNCDKFVLPPVHIIKSKVDYNIF